jgi:hypothetical protein
MKKSWMILGLIFSISVTSLGQDIGETDEGENQEPLNPEVRLEVAENVSKVFRDMVVVQRKAKIKAKHFLVNPNMGVDFSDGPATLYTMNLNLGYAISDFWEVYLNYAPGFIVQERGIVKMLDSQVVYDVNQQQQKIRIQYAKPKSQMGAEVLWAPAYGKDSWGPYTMFRSDTFFKVGIYQVDFPDEKKQGMRYAIMGGKTYFAGKHFNVRVAAGFHHMQTFVGMTESEKQKYNTLLFIEGGLVFYL